MKSIRLLILILLTSCTINRDNRSVEPNTRQGAYKKIKHKKDLFQLDVNFRENFVSIRAPENSDFELPDSMAKTEPFKLGDFNADHKEDILVYLGACGTGGCMYGLFLKQYDNYYRLAFLDYLKNAEFKTEENGLWTMQSSEAIEPYNPSKLQVSLFKWNKEQYRYELDSSYVYIDHEIEK